MKKEVPRCSSAQAKQIKEHLLSEEIGKGDRKEVEYRIFKATQVSGTARFARKCLRNVLQFSGLCKQHNDRKDGNRPGTEVQALGFPLPDEEVSTK